MSKHALLGPWVKRFLLDHLISERNLSRNTQRSYRDTLALFLPFASAWKKTPIDRLEVFDLSIDVLRGFLDHLEKERRCSIRTRNQRLAAVHAMARFIAERSQSTSPGVTRYAPFHSSASLEKSSLIWISPRWTRFWLLPIAAHDKVFVIMHYSYFCTTPAHASRRRHPSESVISTCAPKRSGACS